MQGKKGTRSVRICVTLPEEEYETWQSYAKKTTLSAFVRQAVNEYLKVQAPGTKETFFDLFVQQREMFKDIQERLSHLDNIEGELIDLETALAKVNIIDIEKDGDQIELNPKKK